MAAFLGLLAAISAFFISRPDFFWADVNGLYLTMLVRSVLFSFTQAAASIVIATVVALIIGFSTTMFSTRCRAIYLESLRVFGIILFFAPTLVASLTYLKWTTLFEMLPKFGWVPIVFVHASLNVFFLSFVFGSVMNQELKRGTRLLDVGQLYGLSRRKTLWNLWLRPLRQEFLRWMPLVFWWAFSSFTTVLVLGGGPKYSSPEVLLFYLIGGGDQPARLYLLIIAQLVIGVAAIWYARSKRVDVVQRQSESSAVSAGWLSSRTLSEKLIAAVGLFFALSFAVFWVPALRQALASLRLDEPILAPLTVSFQILWRALAIGSVVVLLGFYFLKIAAKYLVYALVISPMILAGVILQSQWFFETSGEGRLWLTAALCFWSTLPVLAFWVFARLQELLAKGRDVISVFAPRESYRLRFLYVPLLGVPVLCYLQLLILAVLGDVGIVSTIMGSANPSLAQMIYGKVAAYQFDVAFLMFGYLVLSVLPVWLALVLLRRKYEILSF